MRVFTLTFAYILHLKDGRFQTDRVKSKGAVLNLTKREAPKKTQLSVRPWCLAFWHFSVIAFGVDGKPEHACVGKNSCDSKGVA
jgi:hypothetical protein